MTGIASLVSEVNTSSPCSPSGRTAPVAGIDDLGIEMVLPDRRAVLGLDAFAGDAGADHFGQAVDVEGVDVELALQLPAHRVGPRLGAEHADLQAALARVEAHLRIWSTMASM